VLLAGGAGSFIFRASAELYDPNSTCWTATGNMNGVRYRHTATLLPDGKVLVAGGSGGGGGEELASAELYDPSSGTRQGARSPDLTNWSLYGKARNPSEAGRHW